jgi:group I intron endonuclease
MENYISGVIYKVTNLINNKVYIGQTINFNKRKSDHLRNSKYSNLKCGNTLFYKAIRKYDKDNFKWEIIWKGFFFKKKNQESLLDKREKYFIKKYNSHFLNGFGYNMDYGGYIDRRFKWSKKF